ncbi:MAG: hypothetical protein HUN04_00490 [Desulfobacter sp.]|nr:MAG: hypothetical protein HUN04_00490 [Desulfobacter sp.]
MTMDLVCKKVSDKTGVDSEIKVLEKDDPVIACRKCSAVVTRPEYRISVNGGFAHTFANPHGQVFEIGCFSVAEGCVRASGVSDDFSWFKDFVWSVGLCRSCQSQLGWVFLPVKAGERFYGLILDQLIFP